MSASLNEQANRMESALRALRGIVADLGKRDNSAPKPTAPKVEDVTPVAAAVLGNLPTIPLATFLAQVPKLTPADRLRLVDAAIAMLSGVFVHLPLKRAMHGIDPVQRLRLLRFRIDTEIAEKTAPVDDRGFHDEMIEIFHSLRDLHTNYILPAAYQGRTAFLPFLVEEYFEQGLPRRRRYIVTKTYGVHEPPFVKGVQVTHWNGIPIERAVALNAAREAGSNPDARQARGLEALTLRPMGLTAPPDEAWVMIGFEADGRPLERRFAWQVIAPPPAENAADVHDPTAGFGDAAMFLGFDAETEAVRRARKMIFDPPAMEREREMAAIMNAPGPFGTASAPFAAAPLAGSTAGPQRVRSTRHFNSARDAQAAMNAAAAQFESRHQSPPSAETARTAGVDRFAGGLGILDTPTGPLDALTFGGGVPPTPASEIPSVLPDFFGARCMTTARGQYGYIRIYSFMTYDANAFTAEFARLAQELEKALGGIRGLIIDVRKNGGGNIIAGEKVLQLLSPQPIRVERFHFINSPATLALCGVPQLTRWLGSVKLSISTGEIYSQGFPLTAFDAGDVGYRYAGPKVLIIDALCYSTTDIFAAGFQDNGLGKILGTSGRTGAGGANVWPYDYFQGLPGFVPMPLPGGANFRTAVRRSTRVGPQEGVPLEDLGVHPDDRHFMTLRDVTAGNVDLIEHAVELF